VPTTEITNSNRIGTEFPLNQTEAQFHESLKALFPAIDCLEYEICRADRSRKLKPMTGRTPKALKEEFGTSRASKVLYLRHKRKLASIAAVY
jgi:hypothetical protein